MLSIPPSPFPPSPSRQSPSTASVRSAFSVLVVEDCPFLGPTLCDLFRRLGIEATLSTSAEHALDQPLRQRAFHVVFCDHRLPGMQGLTLLRQLRRDCPRTHLILITEYGTISTVRASYRHGIDDFLPKPLDPDRLIAMVETLRASPPLHLPSALLQQPSLGAQFHGMFSSDPVVLHVFETARTLAATRQPILLLGEPGTGRRSLAAAIHRQSARRGPFHLFRPAAWAPADRHTALLSAQTLTEGGTLYIDDLAALPSESQHVLADSLSTASTLPLAGSSAPHPDARILLASHQDLAQLTLCPDVSPLLLAHLRAAALYLPPLRERPLDLEVHIVEILAEHAHTAQRAPVRLTPRAMLALLQQPWPGNFMQLRSVLALLTQQHAGKTVDQPQLPVSLGVRTLPPPMFQIPVGQSLAQIRNDALLQTLAYTKGNRSQAAQILRISRRTLYTWLDELPAPSAPPDDTTTDPS